MEPIRVLHCGLTKNIGGIENFAMNLYRNIDREYFQFDFLLSCTGSIPFEEEIQEMGGKIYRRMRSKRDGLLKANRSIEDALKEEKWRAFHMHTLFKNFSQPVVAASKAKIPNVISHSHCAGDMHAFQESFYYRISSLVGERLIVDKSTKLLACSDSAGKYMFGDSDFEIINNGIDTEKFKFSKDIRCDVRRSLNLGEKFVVGVVSHIGKIKNPEYVVEIFRSVFSRNSNSILLWVGDGELKPLVEKKVKEYNLEKSVMLLGLRTDVSELMQAMDCLILPSFSEGLPLVCVEAQAAGLPVFLSTGVPKTAKIIDTVEFLSIEEQPDVWAEKILKTVGKQRFDTTSEIIKAGFDIKQTARRMEEIYMENL